MEGNNEMSRKGSIRNILDQLLQRYPVLRENEQELLAAYEILINCFESDGRLSCLRKRRERGGRTAHCRRIDETVYPAAKNR